MTSLDIRKLLVNPLTPTLGGGTSVIEGHPQTPGRDTSLHSLRISDLEFGTLSMGFTLLQAPTGDD
jgi:hypothetical protein